MYALSGFSDHDTIFQVESVDGYKSRFFSNFFSRLESQTEVSRFSRYRMQLGVLLLPVLLAVLLAVIGNHYRLEEMLWEEKLQTVRVDHVSDAERLFAQLNYFWPPAVGATVPRIAMDPLPGDLQSGLTVARKKALFFRAILPLVLAENRQIRRQREFVGRILATGRVPRAESPQRRWLQELFRHYRIKIRLDFNVALKQLLRRMDEIPAALVLAQAANESAWGTSRFVRLANNLFGLWTWRQGEGIVPEERPDGHRYAVRKFPSLRVSVRHYLHNLNIGHAYQDLRRLRNRMRVGGQGLDALALAAGLSRYSTRGADYVREIRQIIRGNHLNMLNAVELSPSGPHLRTLAGRVVESTDG